MAIVMAHSHGHRAIRSQLTREVTIKRHYTPLHSYKVEIFKDISYIILLGILRRTDHALVSGFLCILEIFKISKEQIFSLLNFLHHMTSTARHKIEIETYAMYNKIRHII